MNDSKELVEIIEKALEKVYSNQIYLINNNVHERSIVFWFGLYFHKLLQNTKYAAHNLDFDYNRNFSGPKRTEKFTKGTYPDIILHERGSNDHNLLIIEFKTHWNSDNSEDLKKLKDFTSPDCEYKYKYGLSIIWGEEKPIITQLRDGEIIK